MTFENQKWNVLNKKIFLLASKNYLLCLSEKAPKKTPQVSMLTHIYNVYCRCSSEAPHMLIVILCFLTVYSFTVWLDTTWASSGADKNSQSFQSFCNYLKLLLRSHCTFLSTSDCQSQPPHFSAASCELRAAACVDVTVFRARKEQRECVKERQSVCERERERQRDSAATTNWNPVALG